jgi:fumarate hydratase class II
MAEMLDMAMFHVMGCDLTVALAAQAGQLELNVMMPIIAHSLFEAMQVIIGSVQAFTEKAIRDMKANREKALGWLEKNAIVVTALNPLIGYAQGAALVKEASEKGLTIRELAMEKAGSGALKHRDQDRPVSVDEIETALGDLNRLAKGGIMTGSSSG